MLKYFCDKCGTEMPATQCKNLVVEEGDLKLEVHRTFGGTSNAGHLCWTCTRSIIGRGKAVDG